MEHPRQYLDVEPINKYNLDDDFHEILENYFDENFGNYRMNILQKGIFQLKSYYFIILIITMSQKKQIYLNSDD